MKKTAIVFLILMPLAGTLTAWIHQPKPVVIYKRYELRITETQQEVNESFVELEHPKDYEVINGLYHDLRGSKPF